MHCTARRPGFVEIRDYRANPQELHRRPFELPAHCFDVLYLQSAHGSTGETLKLVAQPEEHLPGVA